MDTLSKLKPRDKLSKGFIIEQIRSILRPFVNTPMELWSESLVAFWLTYITKFWRVETNKILKAGATGNDLVCNLDQVMAKIGLNKSKRTCLMRKVQAQRSQCDSEASFGDKDSKLAETKVLRLI